MPAEVSSLLSAQLNRVLKELSREMRRIRTRIALDPDYPFTDECTIDLAALLVADKALASIQLKMIDPGGTTKAGAKAKVKTGANVKTRAKGRAKVDGEGKGKAKTKAAAEGKGKAQINPKKKKPSQARKRPSR
jgi:hypothetical protein